MPLLHFCDVDPVIDPHPRTCQVSCRTPPETLKIGVYCSYTPKDDVNHFRGQACESICSRDGL